ncbi:collagen alpha-1(I) chain-like isoform X2 [Myiozetetes cayanensis]|uniref:collagen alpha-1(I) chain-like isoform X2 n=1 Tax=Myiozetetes cayanensis TaxID=478635 RepID=UPI0021602F04|nr:collagen alpha-1(I) chain-like isoform X2 [Myiozetetes cayanensis]
MALEEKKKNRAKRDPSSEINLESPGNEDLDLLIPANMRIGSPPSAQAAGASGAGVAPGAGPAGSAGPAGPAVLGPDASGVSGSVDGQAGTAPGGAGALGTAENHGEIPAEVENAVIPLVWARGYPGRSKQAEPVSITLKPGATPALLYRSSSNSSSFPDLEDWTPLLINSNQETGSTSNGGTVTRCEPSGEDLSKSC